MGTKIMVGFGIAVMIVLVIGLKISTANAIRSATEARARIKASTVIHEELCPTILAFSLTAADTLAVFRAHEGCYEFVQNQVAP